VVLTYEDGTVCSETSAQKIRRRGITQKKDNIQNTKFGEITARAIVQVFMNKSGTVNYQLTRFKNNLYSSPNIIRIMDDDADPSGRSLAGTVGSNPAKGMDVCLL
jgi:hypothetical protein